MPVRALGSFQLTWTPALKVENLGAPKGQGLHKGQRCCCYCYEMSVKICYKVEKYFKIPKLNSVMSPANG